MAILSLAWKSLLNRRATLFVTLCSIALSVALLIGIERLRIETRTSFTQTVSGIDLIVGARGGSLPLLLYSVFRIGQPTNNLSWESYLDLADHPRVAWTIPLSLGDSHRGHPVLGTNQDYFTHYRYGHGRPLAFAAGKPFADIYDAVLGAEVARALGYGLGDEIIVAHGLGEAVFARHDDKPFRVVGILARTGTPVDQTVHVSLEAIEAIHIDWQGGAPVPGLTISAEEARAMDLTPRAITAVLVGLDSRIATFRVQRFVNEYRQEPLLAILPGVALAELWTVIGVGERALLVVAGFVVLVGLFGLLTVLLTSLNERRREMAILRSVGARPGHVFALIVGEAGLVTLLGTLLGMALLYGLLFVAQPLVAAHLGLHLAIGWPAAREAGWLALILTAGLATGLIPAYRAYRTSLADGLTMRL